MAAPQPRLEGLDGRTRRREQNHRAIARAMLALLEEGQVRPTAARVAQRAGVSLRTLFRHYAEVDRIFLEVTRLNVQKHARLWRPPPAIGGVEARARALARQRARLFEAVRPLRRAARALRDRYPEVSDLLDTGYRVQREQLRTLFASELDRAGGVPLLDQLDAVASYAFWDRLRSEQRIGRTRAELVLADTLLSVLAAARPRRSRRRRR